MAFQSSSRSTTRLFRTWFQLYGLRRPFATGTGFSHHPSALAAQSSSLKRRIAYSAVGLVGTIGATYIVTRFIDVPVNGHEKLDAGDSLASANLVHAASTRSKVIIAETKSASPQTELEDESTGRVPTGTSHVPTFPKRIRLPSDSAPAETEEYQLMGLGVRTVSFLSIQVYVVGVYVAVADIHKLQARLVRQINPIATTLVPSEKETLRRLLLDAEKGEQLWTDLLKNGQIKTALRVVPTRKTDFGHLRDGWVRAITGRLQIARAASSTEFEDDTFGSAMAEFKRVWGGGSVSKGKPVYLMRDATGTMKGWCETGTGELEKRGQVHDERISRLLWLCYLAGKKVSSEEARLNVVNGVMDFVERPVGTVATQVS